MRAVIYVRVSTEEQAREGYSIRAQKDVLIRWIHERGHEFVDEYIDDGHSGKSLVRPQIQRMIKDMPTRKFDLIVFWRMNRLTRSVKDKITLFEMIDKHKIDLKSMTEEIDTTTAAGRMTTNILMSVAQGEREQVSENVHGTMMERAIKGLRNGAVAPYGYDLVDKQLIINEEEAKIVKRIYATYQENRSTNFISKMLTREGVPKGDLNKWSDFSVYYIISNPVYCGKIRWNYRKLSGARTGKEVIVAALHKPIISVEEFDQVEQLRKTRKREGRKMTSDYPYTSTIQCVRCGYGLIGSSRKTVNGRHRFYKCVGRFNYGVCDMPVIAEKAIDTAFLKALKSIKNIKRLISLKEPTEDRQDYIQSMQKELENIKKRQHKFQLAYANDAMTLEELKAHKEDDRLREELIKKELEYVPSKEVGKWSKDEIITQLVGLPEVWKVASDEAKKVFMNDVFDKIVIDTDSVVSSKSGSKFVANVIIQSFSFKTTL
jgi:site-specific DNA recombinase